jgi:hypothetical protein
MQSRNGRREAEIALAMKQEAERSRVRSEFVAAAGLTL